MLSHEKIAKPWETSPTRIPTGVRENVPQRRGVNKSFLTPVYVDDSIVASVQRDAADQTVIIASTSLASDNVRILGPGENGENAYSRPEEEHWLEFDSRRT